MGLISGACPDFCVINWPGEQVKTAQDYSNAHIRLSIYDYFALVAVEATENAILFTGDNALRALAESKDIETRGVLLAFDMFEQHESVDKARFISILEQFLKDPLVWLPENEIKVRIRKLRRVDDL